MNTQPMKLPYAPPELKELGSVSALTQSASGSDPNDNGTNQGGGTMGPTMGSDRRLKRQIRRIGSHPLGFGLYLFRYRPEFEHQWGQGVKFGVMAQEVERVVPEAVCLDAEGYRRVDYNRLGIRLPQA